jgi:hypothetical protein
MSRYFRVILALFGESLKERGLAGKPFQSAEDGCYL